MSKCGNAPFLKSENLFGVLDALADVVVCLDEGLRMVHVNPTGGRFFSITPTQIRNYDAQSLLPQEFRNIHQRFVQRCQTGEPPDLRGRIFRLKLEIKPKTSAQDSRMAADGHSRLLVPVSLSISPVDTEMGRIFVVVIRRRMSVLAAAHDRLQQETAIKTTLSAVSHEIRNPLVAIGGFARRVARDPGLSQKSHHKLDIIQDEVERLERLVGGLNDLSKSTAYHFELVNIQELVEHVGEIMDQQAQQEKKTLEIQMMPDPPRLLIDRDRISQVLINLMRNALQACPAGGRVRLWAGPAERPDCILITITDNGQGITPENLSKLFQPFFTTKKGGTGLGMAVSKRILEDHGGSLKVESVFGQGTKVSILLPL